MTTKNQKQEGIGKLIPVKQELESLFSSIICRLMGDSRVGEPSVISNSIINTENF